MPSDVTRPRGREKLHAMDPGLPFLASQAAIEIDRVLAGMDTGLEAVKRLATQLRNSVTSDSSSGAAKSLIDPSTGSVFGRALAQGPSGRSIGSVDELVRELIATANKLPSSPTPEDPSSLEWARAFCVALSRFASAYRQSIHELRPAHPYRR